MCGGGPGMMGTGGPGMMGPGGPGAGPGMMAPGMMGPTRMAGMNPAAMMAQFGGSNNGGQRMPGL